MSDKQPDRDAENVRRENARVGYQAAIHLRNYEGTIVWARFSVMMAANGILIGASILVLTRALPFTILALALPIVGLALCVFWIVLTWGGLEYFRYLTLSARELEEKYLVPPVVTLSRGAVFVDSKPVWLEIGGKPLLRQQNPLLRWNWFQWMFYAIIIAFMAAYAAVILQILLGGFQIIE